MNDKFLDVTTGFATVAVAKQILDDNAYLPTYGFVRHMFDPVYGPPKPKPRGRQRIRTYYKGRYHERHCSCCEWS